MQKKYLLTTDFQKGNRIKNGDGSPNLKECFPITQFYKQFRFSEPF